MWWEVRLGGGVKVGGRDGFGAGGGRVDSTIFFSCFVVDIVWRYVCAEFHVFRIKAAVSRI